MDSRGLNGLAALGFTRPSVQAKFNLQNLQIQKPRALLDRSLAAPGLGAHHSRATL
jgi:hypothetical protein